MAKMESADKIKRTQSNNVGYQIAMMNQKESDVYNVKDIFSTFEISTVIFEAKMHFSIFAYLEFKI